MANMTPKVEVITAQSPSVEARLANIGMKTDPASKFSYLYHYSYSYYGCLGFFAALVVGLIFSLLSGKKTLKPSTVFFPVIAFKK